jgi:hypothetical protein
MKHRNPNPTPHIGEILVGLLIILSATLWLANEALATPIDYKPDNSPIPLAEMEEAIEYSLWSLTSRIDLDAEYVGLTHAEKTMGHITIQWGDLPQKSPWQQLYGFTEWHFWDINGPDVMVRIILDRKLAGNKVDACLRETLEHELIHGFQGHILGNPNRPDGGHSPDPRDVMHGDRGECRYSPSLADLAILGRPVRGCHVELTPDGNLESLDYQGRRIILNRSGANTWTRGSVYQNPVPKDLCSGVYVSGSEVWTEVKSFSGEGGIYRLRIVDSNFVRF